MSGATVGATKTSPSAGQVELLLSLYREMQLIRRTEEMLMAEYHPADQMRCPIHFCVGQEATPAALALLMRPDDVIMCHHRSHGYYLAKRAPLDAMVAEFYGKATGANGGLAGSQELSHEGARFYSGTILSGMFAIAAGDAFAARYNKDGRMAVGVIGDGGFEEGIVFETINFAVRFDLPLLFICENNLFSAHSHIDVRSTSRRTAERAAGFGIRTLEVDGNDPLELHAQLSQLVPGIRAGKGPVFVEVVTYRTCGHVGPEDDDHLGYRTPEELLKWKQRDPVAYAERALLADGVPQAQLRAITVDIEKQVAAAIAAAQTAPAPTFESALAANLTGRYDSVVTSLTDGLASQFDSHQQETKLKPY